MASPKINKHEVRLMSQSWDNIMVSIYACMHDHLLTVHAHSILPGVFVWRNGTMEWNGGME